MMKKVYRVVAMIVPIEVKPFLLVKFAGVVY